MFSQFEIDPSQQGASRSYERVRRLRLIQLIAPSFGIVLVIVFALGIIYSLSHPSQMQVALPGIFGILSQFLVPGCIIGYGIATYTAFTDRLIPATIAVVTATALMVGASFTLIAATRGIDALVLVGMLTTINIIFLVAVLTVNLWIMLIATLLSNALVILLLNNAHAAPGYSILVTERALYLPLVIAIQWVFAILLIATGRTYIRMIYELSDTRMQVERAHQLDALKDQFITSVNHELRTPAMAIQGYIELLSLPELNYSPRERDGLMGRANKASDALIDLLNTVLSVQRLEQEDSTFTPAAVQLHDAIVRARELIDPREVQRTDYSLAINVPDDLVMAGNPIWIQQILTNLLSNAIKYSPNETNIEITARIASATKSRFPLRASATPAEGMIEISIRDHGLGIPPDQIHLLFQRFVRLPRDLASTRVGNGLGLYLCRVLTERMNGTIWVESTGVAGEGSTFFMRFPAWTESTANV